MNTNVFVISCGTYPEDVNSQLLPISSLDVCMCGYYSYLLLSYTVHIHDGGLRDHRCGPTQDVQDFSFTIAWYVSSLQIFGR